MFRAIISLTLRSTWLSQVTSRQHRRCIIPQALNTVCSAPEGEGNYRPKHVEQIEIINKLLLLHLVGCLNY